MKKNRLTDWWKKDKRYVSCAKAVLMACLPLVACLLYCAIQGKSIGEVYLPSSGRNDEMIYYKQVEAVLGYGYPQGYFGYNESQALKLSFAAWSPVLLLPWVLWGLVFGWNLLSPVLCNIFLLTLAMFLFALLARPTWKQLGIITLLFFLYTPFAWYMLSGMPEIICISILLVFYGAAAAYLKCERAALLVTMFVLAGLLTLMRPYLLLFLLLPMYFWAFRGPAVYGAETGAGKRVGVRWGRLAGSLLIMAAVLGGYACINYFLAAEYFEPLFYMDWLTAFFEKGLLGGMRNFFGSLYYSGVEFWRYMRQGMVSGLPAGAVFCSYIVLLLIILYQTAKDFRVMRRQSGEGKCSAGYEMDTRGRLILEAHLALAFAGMLMAQLLMYNFYDGCKHMLTFLAAGIFVVGLMETRYFKKAVVTGVVFAYFFSYHTAGFHDYLPAFAETAVVERMEEWSEAVGREMKLTGDVRPNYDNVVIWLLADEGPDGLVYTGWQYLYALPCGFGISCCSAEYVTENFDSLRSRYLCVVPGGSVENQCIRMGYEKIAENEYAALYRRY